MSERAAPEWVRLAEGESVVWTGHPSVHAATANLVQGGALALVGVAVGLLFDPPLNLVGLGLVLLGLLVVAAAEVRRRSVRYVVTSREVYEKRGVLSRQVTSVRLDRVQNTGFEQSFLQRVLSYGDVRIETAGTAGTDLLLRAVPAPESVAARISDQLDELHGRRPV